METTVSTPTIANAIEDYVKLIKQMRSENTALTYGKALKEFKKILARAKIDPVHSPVSVMTEDTITEFILHLGESTPARNSFMSEWFSVSLNTWLVKG